MKAISFHTVTLTVFLTALFAFNNNVRGQGRVVVNEFMPWSGCNTTSEFIELMNFGPGPMDIGCHIVTNGQYAVTIPPNTIIQPGEYFVLSGQNSLTVGCGNTDSTIQVDLNWSTCNCTDKAIPVSGDGFLENGGGSNEKIVLLDPNLKVLDAVSRNAMPSASVSITTPALSGSCTSQTFNVASMPISYEAIGTSTGIDNSFARRVDGDCGWVKTTDISANAENKTGSTSSATYDFSTLSASECNAATGSISIAVSASNVAALFPMSYTLAFDNDSNNIFNATDTYTQGADSSAPSIDISNLAYGRYRITVGSAAGCNLQSFDFFIFNCYGEVLPYKLVEFHYEGASAGNDNFKARIIGVENIKTIVLEARTGNYYHPVKMLTGTGLAANGVTISTAQSADNYFRLQLTDQRGVISYSDEIRIARTASAGAIAWPNPCSENLYMKMNSTEQRSGMYSIYNTLGSVVVRSRIHLKKGLNIVPIPTAHLTPGMYQVVFAGKSNEVDYRHRFIKK